MSSQKYKLVYSTQLEQMIAVPRSELVKSHPSPSTDRPSSMSYKEVALFALALLTLSEKSWAISQPVADTTLPQGGQVTNGCVTVSVNGPVMTIDQKSPQATMNWDSYSIGSAAKVVIQQPDATSVHLDRVVGNQASQIFGKMESNGQVYLVNPNGIVFGPGGSVTATSFTATTFGISDADFLNGRYQYKNLGSTDEIKLEHGAQINTYAPGGYVALIANNIRNHGRIQTQQGDVVLASAETVNLSVQLNRRVSLELQPSRVQASIRQEADGAIVSHGGTIYMRTDSLVDAVATGVSEIVHAGLLDASARQSGDVMVSATQGVVKVTGTILARSEKVNQIGGTIAIGRDIKAGTLSAYTYVGDAELRTNGGLLETSGGYLDTNELSRIEAGEWLLDPYNIVISSGEVLLAAPASNSSNTYTPSWLPTTSYVRADTIAKALEAGVNVTVTTTDSGAHWDSGDLTVVSDINVAGSKTTGQLNLYAYRHININANIQSIGSGRFDVNAQSLRSGGVSVAQGVRIKTNGGHINLGQGNGFVSVRGMLDAGSGTIRLNGIARSGEMLEQQMRGVELINANLTAGRIEISGDSAVRTGAQDGVHLFNSCLTATGGGISINGTSSDSASFSGIYLGNSRISSTNGNIVLRGVASGTYSNGVTLHGSVVSGQGSSSVDITGVTGRDDVAHASGVLLRSDSLVETLGGGNLTVTGIDLSSSHQAAGISISQNSRLVSTNTSINLVSDSLVMDHALIDAGRGGQINLMTASGDTQINLGGGSSISGQRSLVVNASMLSSMSAGQLNLGTQARRVQTVYSTGVLAQDVFANLGTFNIYSAREVIFNHGLNLGQAALHVDAWGDISVGGAIASLSNVSLSSTARLSNVQTINGNNVNLTAAQVHLGANVTAIEHMVVNASHGNVTSSGQAVLKAAELDLFSQQSHIGTQSQYVLVDVDRLLTISKGDQYIRSIRESDLQFSGSSQQGNITLYAQGPLVIDEVHSVSGVTADQGYVHLQGDSIEVNANVSATQPDQWVLLAAVDGAVTVGNEVELGENVRMSQTKPVDGGTTTEPSTPIAPPPSEEPPPAEGGSTAEPSTPVAPPSSEGTPPADGGTTTERSTPVAPPPSEGTHPTDGGTTTEPSTPVAPPPSEGTPPADGGSTAEPSTPIAPPPSEGTLPTDGGTSAGSTSQGGSSTSTNKPAAPINPESPQSIGVNALPARPKDDSSQHSMSSPSLPTIPPSATPSRVAINSLAPTDAAGQFSLASAEELLGQECEDSDQLSDEMRCRDESQPLAPQ